MIKHKYVPWTAGKKKFQGKDDKGDVRYDLRRVIRVNQCLGD